MAVDFQCLTTKRPDVVALIATYHPEWTLDQIFTNWWLFNRAAVPQVAPSPSQPPATGFDDSAGFTDLVSYAQFKGCLTTVSPSPPSPAVTGGSAVVSGLVPPGTPPAATPPGGFTFTKTVESLFATDTIGGVVVTMGGIFVAFIIMRQLLKGS